MWEVGVLTCSCGSRKQTSTEKVPCGKAKRKEKGGRKRRGRKMSIEAGGGVGGTGGEKPIVRGKSNILRRMDPNCAEWELLERSTPKKRRREGCTEERETRKERERSRSKKPLVCLNPEQMFSRGRGRRAVGECGRGKKGKILKVEGKKRASPSILNCTRREKKRSLRIRRDGRRQKKREKGRMSKSFNSRKRAD